MDNRRADPDKILKQVEEEEHISHSGKLKIYLGAAPGVGKTYAMLKDAITEKQNGKDVIIGIIESHGRKDIESLLKEIEILPLQTVPYRNKQLMEFSLDDAIRRRPELILIDEMAHTNAPGLRHTKRWQDIRELLDNQIDVYTTLNVQHIESLNDDVSRIIHAPVHETVPDFMLDLANSIELVDLPSAELLKRLHEGKIYLPERAEVAAKHFFLEGNLIALRELALRATAQRVGKQVQIYRQDRGIRHVWSSHEKIMVCVGSGIESLQLIRNGKQLATSFQCEWVAVHINAVRQPESDAERNNVTQYLHLAEQLGADTCQLEGLDTVSTLMSFARDQNITLMMIWKPVRARWREFFSRRTADELVRQSGEIDVYIMTGKPTESATIPSLTLKEKSRNIKPWIMSGLVLAIATIANILLKPLGHPAIQAMVFVLIMPVIALYGEVLPIVVSSIIAIIIFVVQWLPGNSYLPMAPIFLTMSLIVSGIILLMKRQVEAARFTAWRATTLHKLGRQLTGAYDINQIIDISVKYLSDLFNSEITFFLANTKNDVIQLSAVNGETTDKKEMDALLWVFRMRQMAGLGTDTLPLREALYLPLFAHSGSLGVLRVQPLQKGRLFLPEQVHLLETCASQISLGIELNQLNLEANKSALNNSLEHARVEFMQSIARDLTSPLAAIQAYAKILETLAVRGEPEKIQKTAELIYHESNKISHLINNILQISRIDQGLIQPIREAVTLKNSIETLIVDRYNGEDLFTLEIPEDLTALSVDSSLIREVFLNLMDNAVRFSPKNDKVLITAKRKDNMVEICFANKGPPIPPDEIEKVFEKYYQINSEDTHSGLGLGLAICRKIIEAHGGKIWANNLPEQGSIFCFTLPLVKKKK